MEDGIIYIPTETHAERFVGDAENIIDCGNPSDSRENLTGTVYDAGTPESNRDEANALYAGTPSQRLQAGNADYSFIKGNAYVWQDGGLTAQLLSRQ